MLVSCEKKHMGVEGDSEVLNQVDLLLNVKKLVDDGAHAMEVSKIDEDDGLHDSSTIAAFEFDGCLAKTYVKRVGADAWSLMYPSIKSEKLQNLYIVELQDAPKEMVNGLTYMSINSLIGEKRIGELDNKSFPDAMKRTFALRDVYIECTVVGYWGTTQRSFAFDPGGDTSTRLRFATLFVVSWFPP